MWRNGNEVIVADRVFYDVIVDRRRNWLSERPDLPLHHSTCVVHSGTPDSDHRYVQVDDGEEGTAENNCRWVHFFLYEPVFSIESTSCEGAMKCVSLTYK